MNKLALSSQLRRFAIKWLLVPGLCLLFLITSLWLAFESLRIEEKQQYYVNTVGIYAASYLDLVRDNLSYFVTLTVDYDKNSDVIDYFIQNSRYFHRIVLMEPDGKVHKVFPEGTELSDFSGLLHTYRQSAPILENIGITPPYFSSYTKNIVVGITMDTPSSKLLLAELNLTSLQSFINRLTSQIQSGYAFITDEYGNLLAHPDMRLVQQQDNVGNLQVFSGSTKKPSLMFRRNGKTAEVLSASWIPEYAWFAFVANSTTELIKPLLVIMISGFTGAALIILVFMILMDYNIHRIVITPLASFTQKIESIGNGEPGNAADFLETHYGFKELEILLNRFLSMQNTIRQREHELEENEKDISTTLYSIGDAVISTDTRGLIIRMNPVAEELTGTSLNNARGRPVEEVFRIFNADSGERADNPVSRVLRDGRTIGLGNHTLLVRPDGKEFQIADSASPIKDENGNITGVVLVFRDVTEEYKRDREMEKALLERETLLKEIHHRVKNNLSVVAGLLSLQADQICGGSDPRQALVDSRNRILSMAMVHEELYQTENLSSVDMKSYIDSFLASLEDVYSGGGKISILVDIDDIYLDITYAIPCGIIINELVTNSLKYAFPDKHGHITVRLASSEEPDYVLSVTDDGVGLPDDFDIEKTESLGLQLVSILTFQINGQLEILDAENTEFRIAFKVRSK